MAKDCSNNRYHDKKRSLLVPSLTFCVGVLLGFILSPVKHGMGNNSGNVTNHYYGNEELPDSASPEAFQ